MSSAEPEQAEDTAPWSDPGATLFEAAAAFDETTDSDHTLPDEGTPSSAEDDGEAAVEPASTSSDYQNAVEAVSAAILEEDDQWEQDGGDSEALTASVEIPTMEWRDVSAVEAAEDDAQDAVREDGDHFVRESGAGVSDHPGAEPDFAEDETFLDEATLRELVTDIVREELQGALGERITRNVRKLVRREINRALSVQELE